MYELQFDRPIDPIIEELGQFVRGIRRIKGGIEVDVESQDRLNALIDFVRSKGFGLAGVNPKRVTLEEIFLQTVGHDGAPGEPPKP